ncbi:MAG: carbohydrate ABC transporter permease [Nocardioides sp.]|uniref:carbohydrate ABC transporter permease n=1 Tax=Nocardioides sp. TaxID=35761 RepID=UPI003D6A06BE
MTGTKMATNTATKMTSRRTTRTIRWSRHQIEGIALRLLRPVVIATLIVVTLFPFAYIFTASMRDLSSIMREPWRVWPTWSEWTLSAYREVLSSTASGGQGFLGLMLNSAIIALSTVVVTLILAVPGAYAVSRLEFFGRRRLSALFLTVYLFPTILLAVPLFVLFTRLGVRGELAVLVLVYVSQTIAVALFMLRNYFDTIPESIEEAAALDGLGRIGILCRIIIPLSLPSMMSTALFVFMIAWNEFLFALLFLVEDRGRWTVSLGLAQLTDNLEIPPTALMAGSVVLTLPIIIVFFTTQRLLQGGLTAGAEKG